MPDYAVRMYNEALARLHDADMLAQAVDVRSDSTALLRILAFEVLLKCAARLCGKTLAQIRGASHTYFRLWADLPAGAQSEILRVAQERLPGSVEQSNVNQLLIAYEFVFKKARYYYELYEDFTLEQEHELGQLWEEIGAPEHEAEVRYRPEELLSLTAGLRAFIEARLQPR